MGTFQVVLAPDTPSAVTIPGPCSRFSVTQLSSPPVAAVYVTADGTNPVIPNQGSITAGTQNCLPAVTGASISVRGPQPGSQTVPGHHLGSTFPQVQLVSAGPAIVEVEW